MRDFMGRLVGFIVFTPIYIGVVFMGLNYVGHILAQFVPMFVHWLDTRQVLSQQKIDLFNFRFLFSMPPSYKWMHYIFGTYFIVSGVLLPFYRLVKSGMQVSARVPRGAPQTATMGETEGERLERLKREAEQSIEALKVQQTQSVQQPQIQVVPVPVQLNPEQLQAFQTTATPNPMDVGVKPSKTAPNMGIQNEPEEMPREDVKPPSEPVNEEEQPRKSKVIKPARSVTQKTQPKKPPAFKRNRNIGNPYSEEEEPGLEFKKPVGVPDEIFEE